MRKLESVFLLVLLSTPILRGQSGEFYSRRVPASEQKQVVDTSKIDDANQRAIQNREQDNMQSQAGKASRGQGLGMIVSVGAAAFAGLQSAKNMACCTSKNPGCCKRGILWGVGAAAAGAQALNMSKAQSQSDSSFESLTPDINAWNSPTAGGEKGKQRDPAASIESDPNIQEAQRELDKVSDRMGMDIDLARGTVRKADGTLVDMSSGAEAAGQALGLSNSDLGQLSGMVSEAFQEAEKKVISGGIDQLEGDVIESASGVASTPLGDYEDGATSSDAAPTRGIEKKINRAPTQVAGLSKNFNGDPIGVAE